MAGGCAVMSDARLRLMLALRVIKQAAQRKTPQFLRTAALNLVAWGGIEPPTQGFSKHVFVKHPASMRVTDDLRVT
jgi:hypothetical protein